MWSGRYAAGRRWPCSDRDRCNVEEAPAGSPRRRVANVSDRLVWIDCEMTGLDMAADALVEVAALVTDSELNVLGPGVDIVIKPPPPRSSR